jgi:hypothetical protein
VICSQSTAQPGILTVCITANRQLNVIRDLHLHHGRLVVNYLLHGDDDLVNVFLVDLLASLESLNHVIKELLCHLIPKLDTIIVWFDGNGIDVEAFCRRGFVCKLDGGKEVLLSHDLLALGQLDFRILVARVEFDAILEV